MKSTTKGKILIMDDDEVIRSAIQGLLQSMGYEAETCKDGLQAIKMYKDAFSKGEPFDVVVMDLNIPDGMGGKKTMEELLKFDPSAKGIVSTGFSNNTVMSNFKKFGFYGTIEKPYKIEELDKLLGPIIKKS